MLLSGLRSPSSATKKSQRGKQQQQQQQHKREDSWEKLRSPSDDFGPELNGDLQRNGSHNFGQYSLSPHLLSATATELPASIYQKEKKKFKTTR